VIAGVIVIAISCFEKSAAKNEVIGYLSLLIMKKEHAWCAVRIFCLI
jgi:hypothetical protein